MLRRYGLKRLADKYFKGLISCVIKEGNINRRLETFGQMCGLTLEGHKASQAMSESQCSFFFHALGVMFGNNQHLLQDCMNSFVSRCLSLFDVPFSPSFSSFYRKLIGRSFWRCCRTCSPTSRSRTRTCRARSCSRWWTCPGTPPAAASWSTRSVQLFNRAFLLLFVYYNTFLIACLPMALLR